MATNVVTLAIKIVADASNAAGALDKTTASSGRFRKGLSAASSAAKVGLLAVGAAAIDAGKAAAEDAQSQALLANSMKNAAGASADQISQTESWISSMSAATGVADDELRPAMGNLVRATGDVSKSQDAMKVALDVSAATGKDLGSVTAAMAKGYAGSTTALGKLVPGIDKATLASGDMNAIMGELADKTGGAAADAANTTAGQYARMTVGFNEAKESLGAALLPMLSQLAGTLTGVATWMQKNTKLVTVAVVVFSAFATAVIAVNTAMKLAATATKLWAAGQWVLNAAMTANPIGLVVVAIAALVAALVIAYKKSATFRALVKAALDGVLTAAKSVWRFLKGSFVAVWGALKRAANPIFSFMVRAFKLIRAAISNVIGFISRLIARIRNIKVPGVIKSAFDKVRAAVGYVIGRVGDLIGRIKNIKVPGTIKTAFETIRRAIGWVIDKVGDLIAKIRNISVPGSIKAAFDSIKSAASSVLGIIQDIIRWIRDIPVPHINWPDPPGWLKSITGNAATAPGAPGLYRAAPSVGGRIGSTVSGSGGVTITVNGALDPEAVARQLRRILAGHSRRVGVAL